ncbi:MAG TPA: CBS domain-containing protein, partial [Candidatus Nanopelagicales bacterium]|nr:CBS domain-containing protein [Candidatus Nanopelagicales bacterium]
TDLLRSAAEGTEGPVGAIMNSLAIAVHEGMSIAQAAGLMAYEGVHRLPVVDDDWQVVGVVSALDVLHWLGQRSGYLMRAVAPHHQE